MIIRFGKFIGRYDVVIGYKSDRRHLHKDVSIERLEDGSFKLVTKKNIEITIPPYSYKTFEYTRCQEIETLLTQPENGEHLKSQQK